VVDAGLALPKHKSGDLQAAGGAVGGKQWRVAQLAGDVATMDKLLSDDYIGISSTARSIPRPSS